LRECLLLTAQSAVIEYSVSLFYEVQLEALEPKPYKLLQSKPKRYTLLNPQSYVPQSYSLAQSDTYDL